MPEPATHTLDTMKIILGTSVTDELAARFAKHGGHDATLVAEALYLDKTIVTLCNLCDSYMKRMDEYRKALTRASELSDCMDEYREALTRASPSH